MGLLELCLLPLLSAQDPTPTTVPTGAEAAPPAATAPANADATTSDRERLLAAEQAGAKADPKLLAELSSSPDAAVAARAAWVLGKLTGAEPIVLLRQVAVESPHATARRQAMHALLLNSQVASFSAASTGLEDTDIGVRTLAAELLGKLRRPAALAPLLALVEQGERPASGPATDVQAALLALHDLGAQEQLLRLATALHDRPAAGTGQALTWCFQELAPKLEKKDQATLLVAVLDHREPLLRRYAIGRLAELALPTTANALEGRLAKEDAELRPLVELALAQVRGLDQPRADDEFEQALANAKVLWAKIRGRWDRMSTKDQAIAGAIPLSLLVVLILAGKLRRRRRDAMAAAQTMAMLAPSEEHLEQMAAEAEAEAEAMAAEAYEAAGAQDEEVFEPAAGETDGWGEPVDGASDELAEETGFGAR